MRPLTGDGALLLVRRRLHEEYGIAINSQLPRAATHLQPNINAVRRGMRQRRRRAPPAVIYLLAGEGTALRASAGDRTLSSYLA
jgi:hypothetical protein